MVKTTPITTETLRRMKTDGEKIAVVT
ncbi:hypothetical protein MNBD_GAMMA15-2208, partial [hydrothermal vent metagenome]